MRRIFKTTRREYWVHFDHTARVYEMFAEREAICHLGCFDTIAEAVAYAKRHAAEN